MPSLTALERRSLRAKAHHLHPVVAIGAHGLTAAVLREIDVALKAHELIKIRVWSDVRSDREAFLDEICRTLDCAAVQHLGKLLIVWRRNPELHREAAKRAPAPARTPAKRRVPSASDERRVDSPARSRATPPSGAPRAPSRRRRSEGEAAADHHRDDQSRRRRRVR